MYCLRMFVGFKLWVLDDVMSDFKCRVNLGMGYLWGVFIFVVIGFGRVVIIRFFFGRYFSLYLVIV